MATKTRRRGSSPHAEATKSETLAAPCKEYAPVPTSVPGVFRNRHGALVDADGVAVGLAALRAQEAAERDALGLKEPATPAEFLKTVALDPRHPLPVRVDAAKAAAPYTDRKQPQAVDGGVGADGKPLPIGLALDTQGLSNLSDEELATLRALLRKGARAPDAPVGPVEDSGSPVDGV